VLNEDGAIEKRSFESKSNGVHRRHLVSSSVLSSNACVSTFANLLPHATVIVPSRAADNGDTYSSREP